MDKTRGVDPAAVLEHRMKQEKMTLRGVAEQTEAVAAKDADTYAEVTKGLLWSVIRTEDYVNAKRPSAAFWNSIIAVLWRGDWRAFDKDMGYSVPHTLRDSNIDLPAPRISVPHYLDGEAPMKQRQRRTQPSVPATEFLITVQRSVLEVVALAPLTLECRRLTNEEALSPTTVGRILILQAANGILTAAWHLGDSTFRRDGKTYRLPAKSKVIGIAEWLTPKLDLPEQHRKIDLDLTKHRADPTSNENVTITITAPAPIRDKLRELARRHRVPQRHVFEEAILDMLEAAQYDPTTIPPDHELERLRDSGNHPIMSHLVNIETRTRLDELAQHLGQERNRRVYMKELALHALKRALTP